MNKKYLVFISILFAVGVFGFGAQAAFAQTQTSQSVLYVPLIGITLVPHPLTLPAAGGEVTYNYAVKNFLPGVPLTDVGIVDDNCSPVTFVTGDDNGNKELDYSETWRYTCSMKISTTTESSATVTGTANNITAQHSAYSTVVVGSKEPAPLVSIVNITKVAYPLSLPVGGGSITYTYKVNNPGVVSLSNVTVVDNKCPAMSGELGDTNGNGLLDPSEVWIYTCTTNLTQTTTNIVTVTAFANGLKASDNVSLTVKVDIPEASSTPTFPDTGTNPSPQIIVWEILGGILAILIVFFFLFRKNKTVVDQGMPEFFKKEKK